VNKKPHSVVNPHGGGKRYAFCARLGVEGAISEGERGGQSSADYEKKSECR